MTFRESFQFTYDFQFMFLSYIVCHSETNLKVKQALTVTAELGEDLQKLTEFNGEYKWKIHFPEDLPKLQRVIRTVPFKLPTARTSLEAVPAKQNRHSVVCTTGINTTCKGKGPSLLAGLGALYGYNLALHWWQFLWMDTFLLCLHVKTTHLETQHKSSHNCTMETVFPKPYA